MTATKLLTRLAMGIPVLLMVTAPAAGQRSPLYTRWENFTVQNGMPDEKVFCAAADGDRVWAGTENGFVLIENGRVARVYQPKDGLVNRVVMSVAVDPRTGDLWIGTFGGLSRFSGGQFKNYTNLTSGLLNDVIYGVAMQDQFVWVATTAGVSRLNTDTGEWTNWSEYNAPFHEPWAYGVAPAPNQQKVYAAVWGGGLCEYDLERKVWRPHTDPDEEMEMVLFRNQGLIHIIVSNVAYDPSAQMVWASTYFGLSGYDGRDWHNYLTKDSGLASDFINAPKARRGEVWACTDKGLSYLNYKTNTWVTYRPSKQGGQGEIEVTWPEGKKSKFHTATSLAHNYILNMDFQGEDVWVATARGLSHGIRELQKEALLYAAKQTGQRHGHSYCALAQADREKSH